MQTCKDNGSKHLWMEHGNHKAEFERAFRGKDPHRKAQTDVVILEVAMVNQKGCWLKQDHQEPPLLLLQ